VSVPVSVQRRQNRHGHGNRNRHGNRTDTDTETEPVPSNFPRRPTNKDSAQDAVSALTTQPKRRAMTTQLHFCCRALLPTNELLDLGRFDANSGWIVIPAVLVRYHLRAGVERATAA